MTRMTTAVLAFFLLVNPASTLADNDLLLQFVQERAARLEHINHYVVRIRSISFVETAMQDGSCMSAANCLVFDVVADVPMVGRTERQMSALEVMSLVGSTLSSTQLEAMGGAYVWAQQEANQAATGSSDPSGNLALLGEYFANDELTDEERQEKQDEIGRQEPWTDPFSMIGAGGMMMLDTAAAVRDAENNVQNSDAIARSEARQQANLLSQLESRGTEGYAGVQANRYDSTSPPASMGVVDGREVISKSMSAWIDHDRNLLVGHRFDGTFVENGESRDFYVQVKNSDFRNPTGCHNMVKPFKTDVEMGGMLDDEQMVQMEAAQTQLAEFDQQMAELSAAERQMMENMLGSQMDTVRNMAESGTLRHTMETQEILCNPDLKALFSTPMTGAGALAGAAGGGSVGEVQPSGEGLLRQIQVDLKALGYEPGNTDGVLDTMTQVSISQFQAETGLAVTGEPSAELASSLATALGR